ncbi:MAG TPA: hypothetical protein DC056_05015 [Dehalococcoidia bacterium]|nr:hypothetical protein [Dehalococcoidia bacterium]
MLQNDRFWGAILQVKVDPATGLTAQDVLDKLDEGNPRIWANSVGEDTVTFNAQTLNVDEEDIIVQRLREIIS